jgi:hypothetical protein
MKMEKHKHVWAHGFANKLRQLFQGIRNIPGTDTFFFITKSHIPACKHPTYGHICYNYRPQKEEKHCSWLTVDNNCIDCPSKKSTPTDDLTTTHFSSIPSSVPRGESFWESTSPISTSTPPCQTPNTCISISTSSPTKSSTITTFAILSLLTDGSTSRFERRCMVFPKPASLQINYSKNDLPPKGTTNANIHLISGAKSGGTSLSAYW